MPRTKGAKGKKTLAKEMGMTVEQYDRYLKEKEIGLPESIISENAAPESNLKNKKEELIKKENLNPFKPESDEIILSQEEEENKNLIKEKIDELKNKLTESKKSKKDKPIITCERCHKPITGFIPFKINLNYITTLPDYHRQTESDKGRVLLCDECLKKFNILIDKFLYDEGNGIPLKYGQKEYFEE